MKNAKLAQALSGLPSDLLDEHFVKLSKLQSSQKSDRRLSASSQRRLGLAAAAVAAALLLFAGINNFSLPKTVPATVEDGAPVTADSPAGTAAPGTTGSDQGLIPTPSTDQPSEDPSQTPPPTTAAPATTAAPLTGADPADVEKIRSYDNYEVLLADQAAGGGDLGEIDIQLYKSGDEKPGGKRWISVDTPFGKVSGSFISHLEYAYTPYPGADSYIGTENGVRYGFQVISGTDKCVSATFDVTEPSTDGKDILTEEELKKKAWDIFCGLTDDTEGYEIKFEGIRGIVEGIHGGIVDDSYAVYEFSVTKYIEGVRTNDNANIMLDKFGNLRSYTVLSLGTVPGDRLPLGWDEERINEAIEDFLNKRVKEWYPECDHIELDAPELSLATLYGVRPAAIATCDGQMYFPGENTRPASVGFIVVIPLGSPMRETVSDEPELEELQSDPVIGQFFPTRIPEGFIQTYGLRRLAMTDPTGTFPDEPADPNGFIILEKLSDDGKKVLASLSVEVRTVVDSNFPAIADPDDPDTYDVSLFREKKESDDPRDSDKLGVFCDHFYPSDLSKERIAARFYETTEDGGTVLTANFGVLSGNVVVEYGFRSLDPELFDEETAADLIFSSPYMKPFVR